MGAAAVLRQLGADTARGLTEAAAAGLLAEHGPNAIRERTARGPWRMALGQFTNFMTLILIAAALVAGLVGEAGDTIAIVAIVALNAVVGFIQEYRAANTLASLRRMAAGQATVVRGGVAQSVSAAALVPGDIVLLEAGNAIPADLRLIEVHALKLGEAALTGESVPVEKSSGPLAETELTLGDRTNMAYKGTAVLFGRGRGVVVATGMATELGRIAGMLAETPETLTPLQRRLSVLGRHLALAAVAICVVILAIGILRGEPPLHMLLTALSLAVAAIPEALPAVVTVLLALGARRMVQANALIRRLPAVETLGSVSVICSDKTGTLTENRMQATEAVLWSGRQEVAALDGARMPDARLLEAMALCSDVAPGRDGAPNGDPTELALWQAARAAGHDGTVLAAATPRVMEMPFDSERMRMTTFHRAPAGLVAYTKGAPEVVLARCARVATVDRTAPCDPAQMLQAAHRMADDGLRVLAFAFRHWDSLPAADDAEAEQDLTLLGLIGLIDPPRPEARAAVATCNAAGIVPVMITGDHPATALAVARALGIAGPTDHATTGSALAAMPDDELARKVAGLRVYARVDPAQKIRIVAALQHGGALVAMTGDGVNDAPALARADIGVAMGRGGTDVARDAASLVLLDDNFATIVVAVHEGRRIYDNIRKFVRYAVTCNSAEIWTIFLAPFLGLPVPLLPIQILWINLVTDGLPGLALAAEPAERLTMQRPPRPAQESMFARGMGRHIIWVGLLMAGIALLTQVVAMGQGPAHWQTMVFTVLTLSQLGHVLAIRSERDSLFRQGVMTNKPMLLAVLVTVALQMAVVYAPPLNAIFGTEPLSVIELAGCFALSSIVFIAVEIEKLVLHPARSPK